MATPGNSRFGVLGVTPRFIFFFLELGNMLRWCWFFFPTSFKAPSMLNAWRPRLWVHVMWVGPWEPALSSFRREGAPALEEGEDNTYLSNFVITWDPRVRYVQISFICQVHDRALLWR